MAIGSGRLAGVLLVLFLAGCATDNPEGAPPPDNADFQLQVYKGRAYLEDNNPRMAVLALEKAQALAPDHLETLMLLGTAYEQAGRNHLALATFRKVSERAPERKDVQLHLGRLHVQLKEWAEAERILTALKEDPEIPVKDDILMLLSDVYRNQKELDRMAVLLEEVVQSNPEHLKARLGLAALRHQAGDYPGERKHLAAILEGHPGDPDILDRMGDSLFKEGKTREAARIWEELLKRELSPENKKRIEAKLIRAKGKPHGTR